MTHVWPVADLERSRLVGLAFRMLGTVADAEDAVQEAFVRWYRLDDAARAAVGNPVGWFARTTSRICLDVLKSASRRHELYVGPWLPEPVPDGRYRLPVTADDGDPADQAARRASVSMALLTVMEAMTPAERVAFVLHDVFAIPFDEIAPIVERSIPATRQLASRARARVRGREATVEVDRRRKAAVVDAFLAAARKGDFDALLAVLDPDVVLRADGRAVALGAAVETRGADPVAAWSRRARGAVPALIAGAPAAAWAPGGSLRVVYDFTTSEDRITAIELIADPERLAGLELVVLEASWG
jgi:RNA polymerase sigma factor (sigma-70 family)